tara:strand:+ start:5172 stop:6128 length:957 start_codon:yes stop_codon:yes gene_type:complete
MSYTCIAEIKTTGKLCGCKVSKNRKYCGKHDPEKKKRKQELNDPEVLMKIARIVMETNGIGYNDIGDIEDERTKELIGEMTKRDITNFVTSHYIPRMKKLSMIKSNDDDNSKTYPKFTRRFWMKLSSYLVKDPRSYSNIAMTCKSLNKIFLTDKIRHFQHPLNNILISPLNFMYPIYRIIQLRLPKNMTGVLKKFELPTYEQLSTRYDKRHKPPQNDFEESKKKAKIYVDILTFVIETTNNKEKIVEDIEGAGIFTHFDRTRSIDMFKSNIPYKIVHGKKGSFLILKSDPNKTKEIEQEFIKNMIYCNDIYVTKLMKV